MPILGGLAILMQIAFAIHAVRTGRDRNWLYFIIFVPVIGCVVYFFTQVLPDLGNDPGVRRAGESLARSVNPMGELKRRKAELDVSDNIDNRLALADECMVMAYFDEAEQLYASCLRGHHAQDPNIHLKLATAQFSQQQFATAKQTLDDLIRDNPTFKSTAGHLLYARTLEALEDTNAAKKEYEALLQTYPGEEARVRFAELLEGLGETQRAFELYDEAINRAGRAPRYYQKQEKHWLDIAKRKKNGRP